MKTRLIIALFGIGLLCAPAFGANPARPGTVNYIEGAAYLEGQPLNARDVGSIEMTHGQVLTTGAGRVEILLTPGVFLRLDHNSAVKMISPDITLTQMELEHGRAGVEVDEIYPQNNLEIIDGGVNTKLLKTGYYEFDANHPTVMVFKGKADVEVGDGKYVTVKGHHDMPLAEGVSVKPAKFDVRDAEGGLYNWSSLRSQYLAEANGQIAAEYADMDGFYPGWYWDPYMWDYTYIGWYPFWSPFGFGFYPPWGWYGGYWRGGYYGGRYYDGHGHNGHGFSGHAYGSGGVHGGVGGGGFSGGIHSGGFSGGVSGFHGGMGGGGFVGGGGGRR